MSKQEMNANGMNENGTVVEKAKQPAAPGCSATTDPQDQSQYTTTTPLCQALSDKNTVHRLENADFETIGDVMTVLETEGEEGLLSINGIGPKTLEQVEALVAKVKSEEADEAEAEASETGEAEMTLSDTAGLLAVLARDKALGLIADLREAKAAVVKAEEKAEVALAKARAKRDGVDAISEFLSAVLDGMPRVQAEAIQVPEKVWKMAERVYETREAAEAARAEAEGAQAKVDEAEDIAQEQIEQAKFLLGEGEAFQAQYQVIVDAWQADAAKRQAVADAALEAAHAAEVAEIKARQEAIRWIEAQVDAAEDRVAEAMAARAEAGKEEAEDIAILHLEMEELAERVPVAAEVVAAYEETDALLREAENMINGNGAGDVEKMTEILKGLTEHVGLFPNTADTIETLRGIISDTRAQKLRQRIRSLQPSPKFPGQIKALIAEAKKAGVLDLVQDAVEEARKRDRAALAEKGRKARLYAEEIRENQIGVEPGDFVGYNAGKVTTFRSDGNGGLRVTGDFQLKKNGQGDKWVFVPEAMGKTYPRAKVNKFFDLSTVA